MKNLKKILSLALLTALVGCGGTNNSTNASSSSSSNIASTSTSSSSNKGESSSISSSSNKGESTTTSSSTNKGESSSTSSSSSMSNSSSNSSNGNSASTSASLTPDVPDAPKPEGENLFVATAWEEADELQADVNEGANIVYWADKDWQGATVNATTTVENGVFTIESQLESGSNWFGLQVFINVPNNAAGDHYNVSLTLNSNVEGQITFNGEVINIHVGENNLTSSVTVENKNRYDGAPYITAPVSIQFGVEGANVDANATVQNATYVLSNISIVESTGTNPDVPNPDVPNPDVPDANALFNVNCGTVAGAANNYTVKWEKDDYKVTLEPTDADCEVDVGSIVMLELYELSDTQIRFNIVTGAQSNRTLSIVLHTEAGDYKFSLFVVGGAYDHCEVEAVDCTHSTSIEPTEPTEIFTHTSGQFNYSGEAGLTTKEFAWWNQRTEQGIDNGQTIAAYDEETGTFSYSTVAVQSDWWADQFFYKVGASGNVTVSFTITVSGFEGDTGSITINGQVYPVTNGVALEVQYSTSNATTISIQLGTSSNNVNLYGNLSVTFANMSVIK